MQRAVSLFEQGKPEAAILEYRKGLKENPLDSDTWFGLANLYHDLGKDKLALETYAKALTVIDHAPELRVPYAELLLDMKKKAEAVKVLKEGIALDPDAAGGMRALLGQAVLDDDTSASDSSKEGGASSAADGAGSSEPRKKSTKPKSKPKPTQRKKLCKRFCPGSLEDVAPKP